VTPFEADIIEITAPTEAPAAVRLNLGAGACPLEGWRNVDLKHGDFAFPLAVAEGSVDEIRASHILEHFPHAQVLDVLRDWVRALKPGGLLRIAVPDLELIAKAYLAGADLPIQGYLMGGQSDRTDFHYSAFDRESLEETMRAAGLVGIHRWKSEIEDCASYPISLNLAAWKRPAAWPKISAVMSVPRLGFQDNFFAAFQALVPLKINLRKTSGAFWGQCLTRAIEEAIEQDDPEWILTVDYDTVYTRANVEDLLAFAIAHQCDALAPLQAARSKNHPLMVVLGPDGKPRDRIGRDELDETLLRVATAHFGLTLLRADKVRAMPRPWFAATPAPGGGWGEGRVDDDIYFWHQWARAGNALHVATRVPVGHAELMIRWPDENMEPVHQHPSDFWSKGPPPEAWK